MATPNSLSGRTCAVKVDGTDLHSWGMIVSKVDNPIPSGKNSTVSVFGRDGDFDFTKNYSPRTMSLSGYIVGNNNSDLQSNIDYIKAFFRLRENNETFQVIFQNQTDRYWTCKFQGALSVQAAGDWGTGKIATFSLQLKCTKPYAEKTTITTTNLLLSTLSSKPITYNGTLATPLLVNLKAPGNINQIEANSGTDPSESATGWGTSNCTVSASTSSVSYGTYSIHAAKTAAGSFYIEYDVLNAVTDALVTGGGIVIQAYCIRSYFDSVNTLDLIQNGAGGNKQAVYNNGSATYPTYWTFLKVSAADLVGVTSAKLRIICDTSNTDFYVDGVAIYQITAAQYSDSSFIPSPYVSLPLAGSKVNLYQPKITVQHTVNIMQYGKGDLLTSWTGGTGYIQSIADPFIPGTKCFVITGGGAAIYSPRMFYNVKKYLKISFQYYWEKEANYDHTDLVISNEYGTITMSAHGEFTLSSGTTTWTTFQQTIFPHNYGNILRFKFTPSAGNKLYIKNIMVEEADTYAGAYSAYVDYKEDSVYLNSTIDFDDNFIFDSENQVATLYDYSAHTGSNVMTNITGNRLMLNPGTNVIRYTDYRLISTEGNEGGSEGAVNIDISYRERYL